MIYFYSHSHLRDRQIDTVRDWPVAEVLNPQIAERKGNQVSAQYANAKKMHFSLKQKLPLLNIKRRPADAPKEAIVYVWGGLIATGKFIIDLDNPWSMVGYNLRAMSLYRPLIRWILLSERCVEIRCMSEACRRSLGSLFGAEVFAKARVFYPRIPQLVREGEIALRATEECRFLFVGTQFEIKGGAALVEAFSRVHARHPQCHLDMVTHLPPEFVLPVSRCSGITVYEAKFSRDEIFERFMRGADVLILPTYVESFGMVALEALSFGLALIATDVYALGELVEAEVNGVLLAPPVSIWDGVMPSAAYYDLANIKKRIQAADTTGIVSALETSIERFVVDADWRLQAKRASARLMARRFAC